MKKHKCYFQLMHARGSEGESRYHYWFFVYRGRNVAVSKGEFTTRWNTIRSIKRLMATLDASEWTVRASNVNTKKYYWTLTAKNKLVVVEGEEFFKTESAAVNRGLKIVDIIRSEKWEYKNQPEEENNG